MVQFFNFRTLNYDEKITSPVWYFGKELKPDPWKIPSEEYYISFLLGSEWDNGRIKPNFAYFRDFRGESYGIKANVIFAYTSDWRVEIGADIYDGDWYHSLFALMDDRDQIYCKVKYLFNK